MLTKEERMKPPEASHSEREFRHRMAEKPVQLLRGLLLGDYDDMKLAPPALINSEMPEEMFVLVKYKSPSGREYENADGSGNVRTLKLQYATSPGLLAAKGLPPMAADQDDVAAETDVLLVEGTDGPPPSRSSPKLDLQSAVDISTRENADNTEELKATAISTKERPPREMSSRLSVASQSYRASIGDRQQSPDRLSSTNFSSSSTPSDTLRQSSKPSIAEEEASHHHVRQMEVHAAEFTTQFIHAGVIFHQELIGDAAAPAPADGSSGLDTAATAAAAT